MKAIIMKIQRSLVMNEQMSLNDYKKKVEDFLIKNCHYTEAETKHRMKLYEDDFQEFYRDNWSPAAVNAAMTMGY